MTLLRWDPTRDLLSVHDRVNRMFSNALNRNDSTETSGFWVPPVDIYEEGDNLVLKAELPGVRKEDLDVSVENNLLTLSGERRQDGEVKEEQYHRLERFYGKFTRSFTLPVGINTGNIHAEVRDGILTVTLPKAEEAKPKRIQIKAA
jgi:HSP20 family protein